MMINKNIVSFLQFRDEILDTRTLENKYGITLPPIYKSFISVFKPFFAHHKVLKEDGEYQSYVYPIYSSMILESYTIDDDELSLDSFKELEEVFSCERSNKDYLENLLFIGDHGFQGGLLVGIGKDNWDKIYINIDDTIVTFIAENIFELISKMCLVKEDFDSSPVDVSKLYKNWGEDFWRSKIDKEV